MQIVSITQNETVRSLLQSPRIDWDYYSPEVQAIAIKLLGVRTEAKAVERLSILEAINSVLPPASRCAWSILQEEKVQGLPYAAQMVKRIKKGVEPNFAANELLYYYRDCWKRFEAWEKSLARQKPEAQPSTDAIDWKVNDRAIFKGQKCQVDKIGKTGLYKDKVKITTVPDLEELWVWVSEIESVPQETTNNEQQTTESPDWQIDDKVRTPSGLTGRITDIDPTRRVPYCVEWENGAAGWYATDKANTWTKLNQCSSLTNSSAESVDLAKQQNSPEDSPSETTLISTPTPKPSTDTITQASTSTQTSEPFTQTEKLMSSPVDSLARAQAKQEAEPDSITQNQDCGLKPSAASLKEDPSLLLSKIQKGLSTEDLDKYLPPSEWQDITGTIRSSYRRLGLALRTEGTGSLLLPTPTSYSDGSENVRPAGQNKLEQRLRLLPTPTSSNGGVTQDKAKGGNRLEREVRLLPTPVSRDGKGVTRTKNESITEPIQPYLSGKDKMSSYVPGWMMGFRRGYAEEILMAGGGTIQLPNIQEFPTKPKDAETASSSTAEPLSPSKLQSPLSESSTSTRFSKPITDIFLKWAGGKSWIAEYCKEIYSNFRDYRLVSLCLGGGAIELALQPERALLCDLNPYLINCWKWVQQDGKFTIPLESSSEYFLEVRDRFNENPLHPLAPQWFYLLNHTGYNGLQRSSRIKHFNVGWGKYKKFHGQTDLTHYREALSNWEFKAQTWEETLKDLKKDDFLIFDPPYHGTGFKEYFGKFTDDDQFSAASELAKLSNPTIAFNAATKDMVQLYKELGFDVQVREAPRNISCKGDRTPVPEMIATKNLRRKQEQHLISFLGKCEANYPVSPTTPSKPQASGSLSQVGGKKLKNGAQLQRWLFSYSEKIDGKWKTVKRHVPSDKVQDVREAIADKLGYKHICDSILRQPSTPSDQQS